MRTEFAWYKPVKDRFPKLETLRLRLTNYGSLRCRLGWHSWRPFDFPPKLRGETCMRCMRMRNVEKYVKKGSVTKYRNKGEICG